MNEKGVPLVKWGQVGVGWRKRTDSSGPTFKVKEPLRKRGVCRCGETETVKGSDVGHVKEVP